MIASDGFAGFERRRNAARPTLRDVPQRSFGDTGWVTLALQNCIEHLTPAIRSGKPHNIASAVRAIAHAPTPEQVEDVVGAACDTVLAQAYAVRDTRSIANVATARPIVEAVVSELRERCQRDALAPELLRETVDTYVRIVGLLDKHAAQRLDAVGNLAVRIGSTLRQAPSVLLDIELAGRLHDIGMLGLSAACGVEALEQHPAIGETFLKSVPSLAHLAPVVRSHHERFDGRGYPDGLSGDEIPLPSRIIGVAAAFVDLVSLSPARESVLPATACRKLAAASGTEFDPHVVDATLHLLRYRQRTRRSA